MCIKPFAKNKKELDALTLKEVKGAKFMQKIKAAAKKANSAEFSIPFYIDTEHKYADCTACFLHFGKIKPFKAEAKEISKTTGARGAMYVTLNEKGVYIINLMIAQGKIKQENKLAKALKELVAPAKAQLVVGKELDEKALDALENSAEAAAEELEVEDPADASADDAPAAETAPKVETTPKAETTNNPMQAVVDQIKNMITDANAFLKDKIAAAANNVKTKQVSEEDLTHTTTITEKINALKNAFTSLEDKVKNAFSKHYNAIVGQLPNIDKIKAAVENFLKNPPSADSNADAEFQKLLKSIDETVQKVSDAATKAKDALSGMAETIIDGGKELLKKL